MLELHIIIYFPNFPKLRSGLSTGFVVTYMFVDHLSDVKKPDQRLRKFRKVYYNM